MSSFRAGQILLNAARTQDSERQKYSKKEILQKINEIKYLSAQKKVPRLSLRKEILHLEHKLENIFTLEKKLIKHKRHENAKISVLKKQISHLNRRLKAAEDKDLRSKVTKLSHLLGECLAKENVKKEVKGLETRPLTKEETKKLEPKPLTKEQVREELLLRLNKLQLKLKTSTLPQERRQALAKKIADLRQQLSGSPSEVKHKLLFNAPPEEFIKETSDELPLPPPPRIRK